MLIKNGRVFNSDLGKFEKKDVLIEGDSIKLIRRNILPKEGEEVILADGFQILPGFIDVHTHGDWSVLDRDYTKIRIAQGITTEIVGNCGFSLFPFYETFKEVNTLTQVMGENLSGVFSSFNAYKTNLEKKGIQINVGSLVGHSSLLLSDKQISILKYAKILDKLLKQGASGLSTGLDYAPGCYSTTEEIIQLAKVLKVNKKPYVTHMRGGPNWIESVKEIVKILKSAGRVHVSHLKPSKENIQEILQILDKPEITYDIYPFTASQTFITSLIPKEYLNKGLDSFLDSLSNKKMYNPILISLKNKNLEEISISSHPNEKYLNRNILEIADRERISPEEVVIKLIIESKGECSIIKQRDNYTSQEMLRVLKSEKCIIASDSVPVKSNDTYRFCHPRLYSTYPVIFSNLVRKGQLTISEAISKCTSKPAEIFNIYRRGKIKENYFADIIIGSIDRISLPDKGDNPAEVFPFFRDVLINGIVVVNNYKFQNVSPGRVI